MLLARRWNRSERPVWLCCRSDPRCGITGTALQRPGRLRRRGRASRCTACTMAATAAPAPATHIALLRSQSSCGQTGNGGCDDERHGADGEPPPRPAAAVDAPDGAGGEADRSGDRALPGEQCQVIGQPVAQEQVGEHPGRGERRRGGGACRGTPPQWPRRDIDHRGAPLVHRSGGRAAHQPDRRTVQRPQGRRPPGHDDQDGHDERVAAEQDGPVRRRPSVGRGGTHRARHGHPPQTGPSPDRGLTRVSGVPVHIASRQHTTAAATSPVRTTILRGVLAAGSPRSATQAPIPHSASR